MTLEALLAIIGIALTIIFGFAQAGIAKMPAWVSQASVTLGILLIVFVVGWKVLPWFLDRLRTALARFLIKPLTDMISNLPKAPGTTVSEAASIAKDLEVDLRSVNPLSVYSQRKFPRLKLGFVLQIRVMLLC